MKKASPVRRKYFHAVLNAICGTGGKYESIVWARGGTGGNPGDNTRMLFLQARNTIYFLKQGLVLECKRGIGVP
ncbi:MAG: hypothetical protein UY93_C0002G0223 [Parcubacteria group bacterium GW2011_GWA1_56_13]|nr:MAG: hypothetical protein UY93_C0002G0223 [Parcubacteria group bacterium GW2011_GWA1_56_13]